MDEVLKAHAHASMQPMNISQVFSDFHVCKMLSPDVCKMLTPEHAYSTLGAGGSSLHGHILLRIESFQSSHQQTFLQRGGLEVILLLIATHINPIILQAIAEARFTCLLTLGARFLVQHSSFRK